LQTLAQASVYSGTDQAGTVLLLKNGCDGKVFARFSTPYWFSNVTAVNLNAAPAGGGLQNVSHVAGTLTFGGHIDTPEFVASPGMRFDAFAEDYLGSRRYAGFTTLWTAP
jgi:hypothetical protein